MHILRRTAFAIVFGLLIARPSQAADLFLIKEKGTTRIVFTSKDKVPYTFREPSPGLSILRIENVKLKSMRRTKITDKIIKEISIDHRDSFSEIKIYLDPRYHMKLTESYPPFKLILSPEPVTQEILTMRMLKGLYEKGDCESFLANIKTLNLSSLSKDKRENFISMEAKCIFKTDNPLLVLTGIEHISPFIKDEELNKRLRAKKVEALIRLKRYEEALAEGKLFIKEYKDYYADLVGSYMAEALIKLDRKDDAIILLKNLLKAHPDSPYLEHIYKELAKVYHLKDNFVGAYLLLKKAYERNPKLIEADPEAIFMYGSSAYRVGFKEEAKRLLLKTLNLHPNTPEAAKSLGLLGNIYADKKDWKTAEWFYKLCMRLYPHTKAAAVAKIKLAEHYEEIGKYRDALNLYTEAEILYPHMPDILEVALYRKGVMLLRLGRYEEAIQAFKDFMIKVPQSKFLQEAEKYIEEAEFRIAERYYKENRLEDALKLLTQFATRYPQNPLTPEAIKLAGEALVRIIEGKHTRGDCSGILLFWDLYKNFLPRKAKNGIPLFHIAQCMLTLGRDKEAVELLVWIDKNIGDKFPKYKDLLTYLATYYFNTEDYKKARNIAERLISITKAKETPWIHHQLLRLYMINQQIEKFEQVAQKMEKEGTPEKFLVYNHFARALLMLDQNRKGDAIRELEAFTASKVSLMNYPERFQYATILLARIYYNNKEMDKAYKRYLWYFNAFPEGTYTPEALFMLGFIRRFPKDIRFWKICLEKFPQSHWSKEIKAFMLAREILDGARKATGDRSTKGST